MPEVSLVDVQVLETHPAGKMGKKSRRGQAAKEGDILATLGLDGASSCPFPVSCSQTLRVN